MPRTTAPWLLALLLAGLLLTGTGAAAHAATPSHPAGTPLVHGPAHGPSRPVQAGQHSVLATPSTDVGGAGGAVRPRQPACSHAALRFLSSLQTRAPPCATVVE